MAAPYSNIQDKVDRAVAAYLIAAGVGTTADTFPVANSSDKILPNTTIETGDGAEEVPELGLFRLPVTVTMKYPARTQPGEPNPQAQMAAARARAAAVIDALRVSDDTHTLFYTARAITQAAQNATITDGSQAGNLSAANNADLADFTLQWWEAKGFGSPRPSEDGLSFVTEAQFECVAGGANVGQPAAAPFNPPITPAGLITSLAMVDQGNGKPVTLYIKNGQIKASE